MTPFFVDIETKPSDHPLCMQEISSVGMGYPDGSNDLVVEVLMAEDFKDTDPSREMALAFRDRVVSIGGATVGRTRAPMLGVALVGWNVRSRAWPRLALELFRANAPLYNFAAPLSRRYNDVDMPDLRMILTQGSFVESADDVCFDEFAKSLGFEAPPVPADGCGYACSKDRMAWRIRVMADLFGDYYAFSGKD